MNISERVVHYNLKALLERLEQAEQMAHANGAHVTALAINRAKNALGWEIAGDLEQARNAARSA